MTSRYEKRLREKALLKKTSISINRRSPSKIKAPKGKANPSEKISDPVIIKPEQSSEMTLVCPKCTKEIQYPYWKNGFLLVCPECRHESPSNEFLTLSSGNTGYQIEFIMFKQLTTHISNRTIFLPLIKQLTGFQEFKLGTKRMFIDSSGRKITEQQLHEKIQTNSSAQYKFYQAAMNVMR